MVFFKYFSIIVIACYVIVQLFSIVPRLKGPEAITVYEENYRDSNAYIKGYKAAHMKIEVFDVKVIPNDFGERLYLTQNDENLLVDFLKVASALAFAWYIFKLNYENVFSNQSLKRFSIALFLFLISYLAFAIGAMQTCYFYRDLYNAKGASQGTDHYFQNGVKAMAIMQNYWMYFLVTTLIMSLYRTFKNHHAAKSADDVFGLGSSSEDHLQ